MNQYFKSNHEIPHQLRLAVNPIICRVLWFYKSQVVQDFFHQHYNPLLWLRQPSFCSLRHLPEVCWFLIARFLITMLPQSWTWKMAGYLKGNYYWRYINFSLNHDYGRKGMAGTCWKNLMLLGDWFPTKTRDQQHASQNSLNSKSFLVTT